MGSVIHGAHLLLYSADADADRAFVRDVLGFPPVDVGHGWLIFGLPPAEMAVHPGAPESSPEHAGQPMAPVALYLMCDDLVATTAELALKGVLFSEVSHEPWGHATTFPLPSGTRVGLYQPTHPTALNLRNET